MALTKILIAIKTYPTLSETYDELVCTAGFKEDGSWIRVYPIPYRKLNFSDRYKKWQWVEMDVVRNTKDFRKESYRPTNIENELRLGEELDTKNNWAKRKQIVLKNVRYNMSELISEAKNKEIGTSLAVLKPKEIKNFIWEPCEREWNKKKLETVLANQAQGSLFDKTEAEEIFKVSRKVPYTFLYVFTSEDDSEHTLMIEDWEVGMLYWNCLKAANGNESVACQKVKEKYFDDFAKRRDLYFLLGTTKRFHNTSPNPFIIIGTFHPLKKADSQPTLF